MYQYILYILLIVIFLIICFAAYVKIKFRFWTLQPVFHFYDFHYYLFPPGIIVHELPEKNKYCNFTNLIPISEDFLPLCSEKPDYIRDSDSINEIIRKLKEDKRDFSNETFLRLLQLVGRNNIISID
jgi:hypothetical protein